VSRLFTALRAAFYMSMFILFFGWLALSVRQYDASLGLSLPAALRIPGAILMVLGGALALSCGATFVARGQGTPAPFDPPRKFVASGPYRWVRNPMYVGGLALFVGFGLWHRSISILILGAVVTCCLYLFVLFIEEPGLEERFGDSYVEYKRNVRRWLPRSP
jgi:protein-S-isoprenylcysteine O-methyltransferase Ste14